MDNWYTLAIIALILMGTQSLLYKVSDYKKYKTLTAATIFYMVFSKFEPFSTNR